MCVSQVYRLVPWRSAIIWLANTQTQKKLETYTLSQLRDIDSFFSILYSYCTYVYYACWNHCPCLLLQLTQSQVSFPIAPTRLGRLFSSFTHTHTHTISYLQFANPLTSHFPFTPFFFFSIFSYLVLINGQHRKRGSLSGDDVMSPSFYIWWLIAQLYIQRRDVCS